MKIASSPTQIAAQALATNAPLPRRIQPTDLVELTKPSSLVVKVGTQTGAAAGDPQALPVAAPPPRENQSAPTRPMRPGSQLDIKV